MTRDLEWHENKKLRLAEVAAPQMLEALRSAQTSLAILGCTQEHPTIIEIRAAIKAATGEP
jgi:hypothetical protein